MNRMFFWILFVDLNLNLNLNLNLSGVSASLPDSLVGSFGVSAISPDSLVGFLNLNGTVRVSPSDSQVSNFGSQGRFDSHAGQFDLSAGFFNQN